MKKEAIMNGCSHPGIDRVVHAFATTVHYRRAHDCEIDEHGTVAAIVLAPESVVAVRAALTNDLQRSVNILLGSVLASIGLTGMLRIADPREIHGLVAAIAFAPKHRHPQVNGERQRAVFPLMGNLRACP